MNLLIKSGTIIDGTGNPGVVKDILICDKKIVKIGDLKGVQADKVIDAEGLVVSPGFIDTHCHFEFNMCYEDDNKIIKPLLDQGVTTLINGHCGCSPAPLFGEGKKSFQKYYNITKRGWPEKSNSMKEFLELLEDAKPYINSAQLVGQMAVRATVMGFRTGKANEQELQEMRNLVNQALEEGAIGLSYGFEYALGIFTDTEESIEIAKDVSKYNGVISTHIRSQGKYILNAIREAIYIAKETNSPLQISHLGVWDPDAIDDFMQGLAEIDDAIKGGMKIGADVMTVLFASMPFAALLPAWAFEDGIDKLAERLSNPEERAKIIYWLENVEPEWETWIKNEPTSNEYLAAGGEAFWKIAKLWGIRSEKNKKYEWRPVSEIAEELGKTGLETALDIYAEEDFELYVSYAVDVGDGGEGFDDFDGATQGLIPLYELPYASIGSDMYGLDADFKKPGIYGTYPRFIGRIARDWGVMSLEEAIRRCTSLAAEQYNLVNRGLIKEGYYADIVIFDKDKIIDTVTLSKPDTSPLGIDKVIVNGTVAIDNGHLVAENGTGMVIRREDS